MLKYEWNALRVDDAVLGHDRGRVDGALVPGVVVTIDAHRGVTLVGVLVRQQVAKRTLCGSPT